MIISATHHINIRLNVFHTFTLPASQYKAISFANKQEKRENKRKNDAVKVFRPNTLHNGTFIIYTLCLR